MRGYDNLMVECKANLASYRGLWNVIYSRHLVLKIFEFQDRLFILEKLD